MVFRRLAERRYKVNASRSSSVHSNADSCTLDATFVVDVIAAFDDDSSGLLSFFFFVTESLHVAKLDAAVKWNHFHEITHRVRRR